MTEDHPDARAEEAEPRSEDARGDDPRAEAAPAGRNRPAAPPDSSGLMGLGRSVDDDELAARPEEVLPGAGSGAGVAPSPLDALDALLERPQVKILTPEGESASQGPPDAQAEEPAQQFQTIFRQAALDEIREHAESQEKVEVCGVLVGSVYENASGAFAYVEGSIRGTYAAGRSAQVTFTAETWQHIDREMDEKFPGRKIVGWYHTHPGFGIFLSEMDLFIQRHFFNAPWQTAFVYDPQSKERGLFGWSGPEIVRQTFVLDNEVGPAVTESAGPNLSPHAQSLEDGHAGSPQGASAELSARVRLLEQRQKYMLVGMAALMLVAVVWPLVVLVVMSNGEAPGGGAATGVGGGPAPLSPAASDPSESAASPGDAAATARLPQGADN